MSARHFMSPPACCTQPLLSQTAPEVAHLLCGHMLVGRQNSTCKQSLQSVTYVAEHHMSLARSRCCHKLPRTMRTCSCGHMLAGRRGSTCEGSSTQSETQAQIPLMEMIKVVKEILRQGGPCSCGESGKGGKEDRHAMRQCFNGSGG
eukprot:1138593-Pelagomonas_calceolata.AAC.2